MKKKQAVLIAIECVEKEIQRISFDAGLFEDFNAVHGKKYFLKRAKMRKAVEILREMTSEDQIEAE